MLQHKFVLIGHQLFLQDELKYRIESLLDHFDQPHALEIVE
jgi:hypothetical protein